MKDKKIRLPILGLTSCWLLITSFISPKQPGNNLSKQLIGEWRNIYVKIVIHHPAKQPQTMAADSSNWEQNLGIKPIRTHFKEDGTYFSEYRNLKDSIVRMPSGTWTIKGDSLTMAQLKPTKSILKMHVSIVNTKATFSGLIDFEGDGLKDDEYYGEQRKFK